MEKQRKGPGLPKSKRRKLSLDRKWRSATHKGSLLPLLGGIRSVGKCQPSVVVLLCTGEDVSRDGRDSTLQEDSCRQ